LAIVVVLSAWLSVAGAAPPRISPAQFAQKQTDNRNQPNGGEVTIGFDDDLELAPISQVVPRAKTIPLVTNQPRNAPTDDDEDLEAGYDDEPAANDDDDEVVNATERVVPNWQVRDVERPRIKRSANANIANVASGLNGPQDDDSIPVPPDPQPGNGGSNAYSEFDALQPIPEGLPLGSQDGWTGDGIPGDGWVEQDCVEGLPQVTNECHGWGPIKKFLYFNQTNGDVGIGQERVMFAPFEIETSQPANNFRLKAMSAFGLQTPDRAEYLWAKIGGPGPTSPENRVNYQAYDAIYEAGGKRFSLVTDIPLRYMHPEDNMAGAGIGNISLAPKMVIVDGRDWQITQIFRTYLPTGAANRGTSNGLVSLEPGVLVHYRWSPRTYLHSQFKYWVPLTGDPIASGNVFNYGLGISHVLQETDSFAIIPVLEVVGWTVGGGKATLPTGMTLSADTSFVNIQPGVRFVLGPKGDLGLCELGISGGFATNATGWYQEQFTVEIRWSW
jgi:hypothetical protein